MSISNEIKTVALIVSYVSRSCSVGQANYRLFFVDLLTSGQAEKAWKQVACSSPKNWLILPFVISKEPLTVWYFHWYMLCCTSNDPGIQRVSSVSERERTPAAKRPWPYISAYRISRGALYTASLCVTYTMQTLLKNELQLQWWNVFFI